MKNPPMTPFRALVERARRRSKDAGETPTTFRDIADRCAISRQYLYDIMRGVKMPTAPYVHRISRGLRVRKTEVLRALAATFPNEGCA